MNEATIRGIAGSVSLLTPDEQDQFVVCLGGDGAVALAEALERARGIISRRRGAKDPDVLPGFRGDIGWIHKQEGHRGWPYWPGGASGVTLDPGVDLGSADPELVLGGYRPHLSSQELSAVEAVMGIRGEDAKRVLGISISRTTDETLQSVRISRTTATEIFPHVARSYWEAIQARFKGLHHAWTDVAVPAEVHTAMLSLAYNRGAHNKALKVLKPAIAEGDWGKLADLVGAMQQNHSLEGVRVRRRAEGELIRSALQPKEAA